MKRKNRNNLIRLIFVHLLLLAYPLVSKTFHVHHGERISHGFSTCASVDKPEDSCPVCDFEFYNFVPAASNAVLVSQHCISVYNSPDPQAAFIPFINYFSLRAPPVA
ncbi:MAG: hypothetical protein PHP53_12210 [Prolixibacteraceae bacterium]|nr:hypothetical protein [Prolixibacteraceae bacterium]